MIACTVVYEQQGCGKTVDGPVLMKLLGCDRVLDITEVDDLSAVPAGTLVLTNDAATAGALNYYDVMRGVDGKQVIQIVFLDGEMREVEELTFSRAVVAAAYIRYQEGCDSHDELTHKPKASKMRGWRYYKGGVLICENFSD